jgi:hypothetical protein
MQFGEQHLTATIDIDRLVDICRSNDITRIGIFGSVARGEAHAASDIDLLVRFAAPKSLVDVIALEQQLNAVLGRKVDLLTEAALSPYLRERILSELQVLYEA